jgi:hypothetical protein
MKEQKNKLDAFAQRLADWDEEKKTGKWMVEQLRLGGCDTSEASVSRYLRDLRSRKLQERILTKVATGAEHVRKLEAAFAANPAPELETIMRLQRVLVMELATNGQADPKLLGLADQLTRTVLEYTSGKTKAAQKQIELEQGERKLKIVEQTAAQADAAKKVVESSLTAEQKDAEYRRIFGLA